MVSDLPTGFARLVGYLLSHEPMHQNIASIIPFSQLSLPQNQEFNCSDSDGCWEMIFQSCSSGHLALLRTL